MILRRSTTRRVPSGLSRSRSSSQPPCSARSTSIRVTELRDSSRGMVSLSNSYSTPGLSARLDVVASTGGRDMADMVTRPARAWAEVPAYGPPSARSGGRRVAGGVVERGYDLVRQLEVLDGQGAAQLGGGAGDDDRRGHAGPVPHPGQRHL